jgi:hypothetical protein
MWRTPTSEDVLSVLNETERAAYVSIATGDGQDVMTDVIKSVVNWARGYINDNAANSMADGVTLPERCFRPALHIIRKDLITRLNLELTKDRESDAKEAIRFFERVAEGKVRIEQPVGLPIDTSGATPVIDVVKSENRRVTRESLRGI